MDELNQEAPSKVRIAKVEWSQDDKKQKLSQISKINKDVLNIYLVNSVNLATMTDAYIKRMHIYLEQ
jgi:hypothetical protein